MNFIYTDEPDQVRVAGVCRLSRDDIPFFGCRNDDLGLGYLLLGQLSVTSELSDASFDAGDSRFDG